MIDPQYLVNPTDVDSITKIMAKWELLRSLGNAGEHYLTRDKEKENMERELMRLSIEKERRMLGYEDSDDYQSDLNMKRWGSVAAMSAKRNPGMLSKIVGESSLTPTFKWATLIGNSPMEGASHDAGNAILRAISRAG